MLGLTATVGSPMTTTRLRPEPRGRSSRVAGAPQGPSLALWGGDEPPPISEGVTTVLTS